MTDEEKLAEEYVKSVIDVDAFDWKIGREIALAYIEGLKAGRPKWHKVADGDLPKGEEFGKNSVHRKIYLKDRYGNLYTGNYYPKDDTHKEDCFAVEFLDWGLQGSQFCAKEQISKWCEIPLYEEE